MLQQAAPAGVGLSAKLRATRLPQIALRIPSLFTRQRCKQAGRSGAALVLDAQRPAMAAQLCAADPTGRR